MDLPIMSPDVARAQRLAYAERQREKRGAILAALGHPAGRAFLDQRLAEETARLTFHEGQSHQALTHQLGRISMLRDLVNQLAQASAPEAGD